MKHSEVLKRKWGICFGALFAIDSAELRCYNQQRELSNYNTEGRIESQTT